ncbi:MAG: PopZ family protein [Bosea sp. (in: a-proteobacteria)]
MSAQPKPNDPSMEDILASIRRIIADDQAKVAQPTAAPAPAHDDVLNLGPAMRAIEQADTSTSAGQDDVDLMFRETEQDEVLDGQGAIDNLFDAVDDLAPEPAYEPELDMRRDPIIEPHDLPLIAAPRPMRQPEPEPTHLLSSATGASVSGAFSQLAHTVLSQNARTLDDLVQEMLRPMLKGWLDENLPALVERLVKAEIERVARGGK